LGCLEIGEFKYSRASSANHHLNVDSEELAFDVIEGYQPSRVSFIHEGCLLTRLRAASPLTSLTTWGDTLQVFLLLYFLQHMKDEVRTDLVLH